MIEPFINVQPQMTGVRINAAVYTHNCLDTTLSIMCKRELSLGVDLSDIQRLLDCEFVRFEMMDVMLSRCGSAETKH